MVKRIIKRKKPAGGDNKSNKKKPNNWPFWIIIGVVAFMFFAQSREAIDQATTDKVNYSRFYDILQSNKETGRIQEVVLTEGVENVVKGKFDDGEEFRLNIPREDEVMLDLLRNNVSDFSVVPAETFWSQFLFSFMPVLLIIGFIWFISQRGAQMGNKIWSFGKSKAKSNEKGDVTFNNVAGVDEAKEELEEVIEFLRDPKKFERLGGKIPKGVLLIGPPGTGKTLLAKAVAGEAGVPFFSLSGSDFVEMFVGVGASRVRDLFEQSRKASKASGKGCIIFIDEIDAVGRQRFTGVGGGNDEREQTLNALLVEMDGFNSPSGLIVMAATNRPDTLDPALLRPGRFDRQVTVGLPDINGREGILKVHSANLTLADNVDFKKIARQTVYFSGADLSNVCNEAALLAARKNKEKIEQEDFHAAVERVTMGPEKKSRPISKREKNMTAYHEAGHALLSLLLDEVDTFTKVSIIPRGMAGGYTLTPPTEDKHYYMKSELKGQMVVLLGGMVAEELVLQDTSTGVSNDLQRVAQIARGMVCTYGMNDELGTLAFGRQSQQSFLGRDMFEERNYSDKTAAEIDREVMLVVKEAYDRAKKLLTDNRDQLDQIAGRLMEKEVIDIDETRAMLGLPPIVEEEDETPSDVDRKTDDTPQGDKDRNDDSQEQA